MLKLFAIMTICLTPSIALAAESDKAGHSSPPAAPGYDKQVPPPAAPKAKVYPPVMGKDLDALRNKLESEQKEKEGERMKKFDAPLGPGQTLAPGTKDVEPVVAAPPPPQPDPTKQPIATVHAMAGSSIPKGWIDCGQTHAADICKELARTQLSHDRDYKMIIKLGDSGKVEELNAFLDSTEAARKARE